MKGTKDTIIGKVAEDWELGEFSKDLRIKGRIGWKGYKTSDLVDSGPIVIGGTEIKSFIELNLRQVKHLSREKYEESPEIMLKDKDVLLVTRGNLGEVGFYHSKYGEGTINPSVIILNEFVGEAKFLFYYLISKHGNHQVLSLTSGSSIPAIYQSDVKNLLYPKPPLPEQKAIAQVLTAFDDKIELLKAQNKTLETMAQTIFKEWFGKYQVGDELPEGWRVGKLGDYGRIVTGKTPSKKNPKHWGNQYPFVTPTDYKNFGLYSSKTKRYLSELGWNKMRTNQIQKKSIMVTCIGSDMWKVSINFLDSLTNQQINSIILSNEINLGFVYEFLKSQYQKLRIIALGGSTMPIINKSAFSNIEIPVPTNKLLTEFQRLWDPISLKVLTNSTHIQSLTKTRDTLLPKLMSGQVRVNNIKQTADA